MVSSGVNRTNNPLEKYNRDFADLIGVTHPTLLAFITKAKEDALAHVQEIEDIERGVRYLLVHSSSAESSVPLEYTTFVRDILE